jgi:hypothetical protein
MSTREMLKVDTINIYSKDFQIKNEKQNKEKINKNYEYSLNKIKKTNEKYETWYNENYSK